MKRWAGGIAASLALHLAIGAGLALAFRPVPPGPGENVSAELSMAGEPVPQSRAEPSEAETEAAGEAKATGDAVGTADIPRARANATSLPSTSLAETGVEGDRAEPAEGPTDRVAAAPRPGRTLPQVTSQSPRARPAQAPVDRLAAQDDGVGRKVSLTQPQGARLADAPPDTAPLRDAPPQGVRLTVAPSAGVALAGSVPEQARVSSAAPETDALATAVPDDMRLASATPDAPPLEGLVAPSDRVSAPADLPAPTAASIETNSPAMPPSAARATRAEPRPAAEAAEDAGAVATERFAMAPPTRDPAALATQARAGLAWSGGQEIRFDAQSLATVQSFMAPARARDAQTGGDVRDGISAMLADVPCSRLQAAFVPETGALEIRGHVPLAEMRGEVEARLQAMIGGAIEVGNDLLLLPAPQCEVLAGIDGLGLPQSTDQTDDPLTVGQVAQAAILTFYGGQTLSIPITETPDYDAYLYVDYFDADGNVLHLVPNEQAPLRYFEAKSRVVVGGAEGSFGGLQLTVSPPFGRDIFVVLATTEPLYDGLRPLIEPAAPYLDWVAGRLAEMRERAGFKGEWVYLFIDTAAQ